MSTENQKSKNFFDLMKESVVSREDFTKLFEQVINFVLEIQKKNNKEVEEIKNTYAQVIHTLKEENNSDFERLHSMVKSQMKEMSAKHEKMMHEMTDKIREIKNGEDGKDSDEERIINEVLARIKLPEQKEILPDTPVQLRDKLETLEGDEQLKIPALKDIEERIKKLEETPRGARIVRGTQQNTTVQYYDLSSETDGSTKVFTIPKNKGVVWVGGTDAPGGQYRQTTDYTATGRFNRTLTLTSAVAAPGSGATLHILYISFFNP